MSSAQKPVLIGDEMFLCVQYNSNAQRIIAQWILLCTCVLDAIRLVFATGMKGTHVSCSKEERKWGELSENDSHLMLNLFKLRLNIL